MPFLKIDFVNRPSDCNQCQKSKTIQKHYKKTSRQNISNDSLDIFDFKYVV